MASTKFNIGIEGRSSSRVLKPPGGGHSDIFGSNHDAEAPRQGKMTQKSSISECFSYDNGVPVKQTQEITKQIELKEDKVEDFKNGNGLGNGLLNNGDENIKHVEEVVIKQQKSSRVPPGGFSSGFW